jgi:hypothetical protein
MCTYRTVRTVGQDPILIKGLQEKSEVLAHLHYKPLESQGQANVLSLSSIFLGPQADLFHKLGLTREQH